MTPQLTPEQVERNRKWAEALESGRFKQGRRRLLKGDCFCCLGVAEIVRAEIEGRGVESVKCEIYNRRTPADETVAFYGWGNFDPILRRPRGTLTSACRANDEIAMKFPGIATCVRRTYVEPFEVRS